MKENKNVDTTKTTTHLGLCAGYGGIELGLKRVIPNLRSVALCEIEAFACANLVAKMEAGLMEPTPIWTDLKTFPWAEFRDRVDILTGGYPCQPFSAAGKRLGTEDPRHLWPFIADGIRILRPKLCFFENVEGHISLGLREVVGELENIGYQTAWGIFSASEVGAPHQRKRVFILAYRNEPGWESRWHNAISSQGRQPHELAACGCDQGRAEELAYDKSLGIQGCGAGWLQEPRPHAGQALPVRGCDAGGEQWPSRPGEPQHAWEPPRVVADARCGKHGWREIGEGPIGGASCELGEANEALGNASNEGYSKPKRKSSKRTQGESNGHFTKSTGSEIEPPLCRDLDGSAGGLDYAELCVTCDNRTDELRLLGNGVVPATAERAFRFLMAELQQG